MNDQDDGVGQMDDNICRDFLRNVCKRGGRCKYYHPDDSNDSNVKLKNDSLVVFCHDFQNNGCTRPTCKYTHCTREEQEYYNVSGQLPERMKRSMALGLGPGNDDMALAQGDIPICKDHLKGSCNRGNKCKYKHVNYREEGRRRSPPSYIDMMERQRMFTVMNGRAYDEYDFDDRYVDFEHSRMKRRRMDIDDAWRYQLLDEENIILRHKIDAMKQQISDLKATNEVLLEQNARYRLQKANAMSLQAPISSAVSLATGGTVNQVSHLAMNNDLAAAATQRAALQHMPASGAAVGLNPVSMVAVSLPQNNMGVPASLAQNITGLVAYPRHSASSMAL